MGPSTKVITAGESDRQISCVVDEDGRERGEDRAATPLPSPIQERPPHFPTLPPPGPLLLQSPVPGGRTGAGGKEGQGWVRLLHSVICPQGSDLCSLQRGEARRQFYRSDLTVWSVLALRLSGPCLAI